MLQEFCPDCGTRRVALFRWCRTCGLDYDDLDARGELPGGPYSQRDRGEGRGGGHRDREHRVPPPAAAAAGPPRRPRAPQRVPWRDLRPPPPVDLPAGQPLAGVRAGGRAGPRAPGRRLRGGPRRGADDRRDLHRRPARRSRPRRPVPSAEPAPTPEPSFVPSGPTSEATVERVIDGDTIVVDAGGARLYVHYIGMDAPEAVTPRQPGPVHGPRGDARPTPSWSAARRSSSSATCPRRTAPRGSCATSGSTATGPSSWSASSWSRPASRGPSRSRPTSSTRPSTPTPRRRPRPPAWASGASRPARPGGDPAADAGRGHRSGSPPTTRSRSPTGSARTSTGRRGATRGATVNLTVSALKVAWTVDARIGVELRVRLVDPPASGTAASGEVSVPRKGHETGQSDHETPFRKAHADRDQHLSGLAAVGHG